jgi:hypothetical protein
LVFAAAHVPDVVVLSRARYAAGEIDYALPREGEMPTQRVQRRPRRRGMLAFGIGCAATAAALAPHVGAADVSWVSDVNGDWLVPANWSGGVVPTAADSVLLDRGAANPLISCSADTNYAMDSLTASEQLRISAGTFSVATGLQLNSTLVLAGGTLRAGAINAGTDGGIVVVPGTTGALATIRDTQIHADTTINNGRLMLRANWRNTGTLRLNGGLLVFDGGFSMNDVGTVINQGGEVVIEGQLHLTGQTLRLDATTGSWNLQGGAQDLPLIEGGRVEASQGARLNVAANAGLVGTTLATDVNIAGGTSLRIRSGLTLDGGRVTVGSGNVTTVWFEGENVLDGNGTVELTGNVSELYVSAGGSGGSLTIGDGVTVTGGGYFGPNGQRVVNRGTISSSNPHHSLHVAADHGTFSNQGVIEVRPQSAMVLDIGGPGWSNTGVIRVSGGELGLRGTFNQETLGAFEYTGGYVGVAAVIENAGRTLRLSSSTGSWDFHSTTVRGGTLAATDGARYGIAPSSIYGYQSNTWLRQGVTLAAPLDLPDWSRMTVYDGLTLDGTINMSSASMGAQLIFDGAQTLSGSGEIRFAGGFKNSVRPTDGATFTVGAGVTVRGAGGSGTIGNAAAPLVLNGTVSAETAGHSINVIGSSIRNNGAFAALNGGSINLPQVASFQNLSGGVLSGGTYIVGANSRMFFEGASITSNAATVRLDGPGSAFPALDALATNEGNLRLSARRTFTTAGPLGNSGNIELLSDAALVVRGELTNVGSIDVTGTLAVDYTGPSSLAVLQAQVAAGYADGAWTPGPGITSSGARAASNTPHPTAIGIAEATDLFTTFPAVFRGQTIDASTVLLQYTLAGDANVDGVVNLLDFNVLARNFGQTGRRWSQGDFTYGGAVNLVDFNLLAANFGYQASGPAVTPQDWANLAAVVPEPAGAAALAGLAVLILRRGRRRRAAARR